MRTVAEQQAHVLAAVRRLPTERVGILEALERTLAEPVVAAVPIPVFDNSGMDGFAVRTADAAAGARLRVVAEVAAGSGAEPAIQAGEAVRIMTGAAMPRDAGAVVPVEDTAEGFAAGVNDLVTIVAPPRSGAHIRRAGQDAGVGDVVLDAGVEIGPLQLSAIAAAGVGEVVVARRPRVGIVATGSELRTPGETLERGQIPESNSYVLAALAAEAGCDVEFVTSVPDDPAALLAVLEGASGCDAILMSGGVSEGAHEPVKQALGGTMSFEKVSMQPGKPQGFGTTSGGALLFGFPGNPVSVAVSWEVFGRPALLAMQGRRDIQRARLLLPTRSGWRSSRPRTQYIPVSIDRSEPARWTVGPATAGGSGSHLAGGLARAEAYAIVPPEVDEVAPGDLVEVMLLG